MRDELDLEFYRPHLADCKFVFNEIRMQEEWDGFNSFTGCFFLSGMLVIFQEIMTVKNSKKRMDELGELEYAVLKSIDILISQIHLHRYREDLVLMGQYQSSIRFVQWFLGGLICELERD